MPWGPPVGRHEPRRLAGHLGFAAREVLRGGLEKVVEQADWPAAIRSTTRSPSTASPSPASPLDEIIYNAGAKPASPVLTKRLGIGVLASASKRAS